MIEIHSASDVDRLLQRFGEAPILVLKHSTACPVSHHAYGEVTRFEERGRADVYLVKVIENRAASNRIAEKLGVRHQSPQVILVKDGKAVWSASHYAITQEAILDAVAVAQA